jgi:hypothetical protein
MLDRGPFAEELRKERHAAKDAADCFVRVCQTDKAEAMEGAAQLLNETVSGWTVAMHAVARRLQSVSPEIQQAFLSVWVEHKMLPLTVGDHRALCDAARILLPPYHGPAVRLFRGAAAGERRRRIYGLSWTPDMAIAERFARERQQWDGGSVVLETLAPPAAIICSVDYPEPFTVEELKREFPGLAQQTIEKLADSQSFHEEREYVIDRRHLGAVTVASRYAQTGTLPPFPVGALQ